MPSILSAPHFHNEAAAFDYVEARLWPHGPVCPHCGATAEKIGRLSGKSTRIGVRKCYVCRKPFTVKVGTIFESSHVKLHIWLQAMHLMASSKKGVSTNQLHRILGVSIQTAWFLSHRIREAMAPAPDSGKIGGSGKTVEADETFITKSRKTKRKPFERPKAAVMSLVERGGNIRSVYLDHRMPVAILYKHMDPESRLVTDKAQHYKFPPAAKHESVNHSIGEYVRGDVHTNTLEGFFSIFKRGLVGVYQHVDEKHLDRYLAEFDFRQNNRARLGVNDVARTDKIIQGAKGKRLTYRTPDRA